MDALTAQAVQELQPLVGTASACAVVGRPRATYYRRHRPPAPHCNPEPAPRAAATQPRTLSAAERAEVRAVLHSGRFVDQAPASVYATLLDEQRYLCSVSTMYRVLRADGEVRERRRVATHPAAVKPELVATRPNEVWSWALLGTSPGCWDRPSGPTPPCTSSSTSTAATCRAGCSPPARRPRWRKRFSPRPSREKGSRPTGSPSMPTGARRWPPSRSRCSSPTLASPRATPGRTARTTAMMQVRHPEPGLTHRNDRPLCLRVDLSVRSREGVLVRRPGRP